MGSSSKQIPFPVGWICQGLGSHDVRACTSQVGNFKMTPWEVGKKAHFRQVSKNMKIDELMYPKHHFMWVDVERLRCVTWFPYGNCMFQHEIRVHKFNETLETEDVKFWDLHPSCTLYMLCVFALRPSCMKTVDVSLWRLGGCCPWDLHSKFTPHITCVGKFGNVSFCLVSRFIITSIIINNKKVSNNNIINISIMNQSTTSAWISLWIKFPQAKPKLHSSTVGDFSHSLGYSTGVPTLKGRQRIWCSPRS